MMGVITWKLRSTCRSCGTTSGCCCSAPSSRPSPPSSPASPSVNGGLVPRAQQTWSAATTMLLTSESAALFEAELPGVPLQAGRHRAAVRESVRERARLRVHHLERRDPEGRRGRRSAPSTPTPSRSRRCVARRSPRVTSASPAATSCPCSRPSAPRRRRSAPRRSRSAAAAAFVAYLTAQQDDAGRRPRAAGAGRSARRQPGRRGRFQQPGDPGRRDLHRRVPRVRGAGIRHRRHPLALREAQGRRRQMLPRRGMPSPRRRRGRSS